MAEELVHRRLNREWYAKNAFNILLKLGHELAKADMINDSNKKLKILDVACGPGGNCALSILKKYRDKKIAITAIDNDPKSIIELTRHVEDLLQSKWFHADQIKAGLSIKLMDVTSMKEYKNLTIDRVAGVGALSNFDQPAGALKEIYRVLNDEGQLLLGDFFVPKIAQNDFKDVTKNNYGKKRPYIDYHDLLKFMDKFDKDSDDGFEILSYMPVRWLHNIRKYNEKQEWEDMPDPIKYGYMELSMRPDKEDSIVYSSFYLKAMKKGPSTSPKETYKEFTSEKVENHGQLDGTDNPQNLNASDNTKLKEIYDAFIIPKAPPVKQTINLNNLNIEAKSYDLISAIGKLHLFANLKENGEYLKKISYLLQDDGKLIIADMLQQTPKDDTKKALLDYYDLVRIVHEANFCIKYFRPEICKEDNSKSYFLLVATKIKDRDKKYDIYNPPEFNAIDFNKPYALDSLFSKIKEIINSSSEKNTLDLSYLNNCLSNHLLAENLLKDQKEEDLSDRIKYWRKRVAQDVNNIHAIKMLNRFLLEYKFPNETPKLPVCDQAVWEIWD